VADIAQLPDEVFSLSTAFLSAGSAGAIATLWSIDDLTTAMLMTRCYEEMLANNHAPAEALRLAQRWLRDISEEDEAEFLAAHPALEAEFARRARENRRPGERGSASREHAADPTRPYAHPSCWAPFLAVGA
jgi:CHAT domain-containing protein